MAIRMAYARARHSPPDKPFVELYAIGVLVSGSTEANGLGRVSSKDCGLGEAFRIGSAKSSTGHAGFSSATSPVGATPTLHDRNLSTRPFKQPQPEDRLRR